MKRLFPLLMIAILSAGLTACSSAPTVDEPSLAEESSEMEPETLGAEEMQESTIRMALGLAAEGDHRPEEHRMRNQYRNPVETLEFFGLQPDQTVVELSPGRGWYTEVLAPVLAEEGTLIAGAFRFDPDDHENYMSQIGSSYVALLEGNPEIYSGVHMGLFAPPAEVEIGEPESADLVLSFRNMHGWNNRGIIADAFSAVYEVLKPGGVFGVVTHRAAEGSDPAETSPRGYLPESFVIEMAESAGFVLDSRSEVNANPLDTRDHEHGVWSLPPTLRGGEESAETFLEIGESDRMTLRFVKPS